MPNPYSSWNKGEELGQEKKILAFLKKGFGNSYGESEDGQTIEKACMGHRRVSDYF